MHAWEQIQKTVDYIEEHLADELDIVALAEIAALSPFYYQRLFSRLVKKPVNEYIKLRRLAGASEMLMSSQKRILDIAMDYGFSSHTSFSRAFKQSFGITPEEYRGNPMRLNNFMKPQLLLNYTLVDENVPLIAEGIVIEISRLKLAEPEYFIGLSTEERIEEMPGGGNTGVDSLGILWDSFHKQKSKITGLKTGGDEIGVAYGSTKAGYYSYFAGAAADSEKTPDSYVSWKLSEGEYIICAFEAEDFEHLVMDAVYKAHKYLFETWLPRHQLKVRPFAVERYASHDPETTKMEVWVMPTV